MAEEERCVLVVTQSLEQLSSRLHAAPNASPSQGEGSEGVVTVAEGAQFVALMDSVVHAADPKRMRELTLSLQPQLIPTLASLLQSESLLRAVEEPNAAALFNQVCNFLLHATQIREMKDGSSGTSVAIVQDVAQAITQAQGVDALLRLALHAPQEEVYVTASQTLFSVLHVSPHARQRMTDEALFRVLVRSLGDDTIPRRRHVLALCLREVVNAEPFTVASSAEAILVLVRAFSLDDNADVQCAAAESLEMLLKADAGQWKVFGRKREMAMGIIGILEKAGGGGGSENSSGGTSTPDDVAVAALRLLETAVRCEGCVSSTEAMFFVPFLKAFGDRHLARLHSAGGKVGALSARCLRLVVQYAPPASGLGVALMTDTAAVSSILEGLLNASQAPPPADDSEAEQSAAVLHKVLCVEAAFCIALILAQDPQCRQSFSHQLVRDPQACGSVRTALVKGLNAAALEYYNDTAILDVTGSIINDPRGVTWEVAGDTPSSSSSSGGGSQKRPTQISIKSAVEEQEERLIKLVEMAESTGGSGVAAGEGGGSDIPQQIVQTSLSNLAGFAEEQSRNVEQCARLTFIILSYATFITLRVDEAGSADGGDSSFVSGSSPRRAPGVVQGILGSKIRSPNTALIATAEQPAPTRASLLRSWSNNPRQREALEKAAAAAAAGDTSLVTNPKPSTYVDVMMKRDPDANSPTRLAGSSPSRGSPSRHHQQQPAPGHSSAISLGLSQTPMKTYAFSKFDSALSLATAFSQFYNKNGDVTGADDSTPQSAAAKKKAAIFETDGQFARRKDSHPKRSHYAAPTPNAKAWGIPQLKEGDLFYFSIPLSSITTAALEQVQHRAVRHLKNIKDQFTVTPHSARARRWFLFDMLNNIMPGIISCLSELIALCDAHGEESVKFPLLLFAESNAHRSTAGGALSPGAALERGTLHSGNLVDATAQARFYFQSVTQQQAQQQARTQASPMASALTSGEEASSTYLRDLERKIASLAEQRFSGHERAFPSISDDEDDDIGAGGNAGGNAVVTPGAGGASRRTNNYIGRKDLVNARPNRRRGMGRSALDRIGDDSD